MASCKGSLNVSHVALEEGNVFIFHNVLLYLLNEADLFFTACSFPYFKEVVIRRRRRT